MQRPYIIYHMITTMDGKITGSFREQEAMRPIAQFHDQCRRRLGANGFLCGRVTMQERFAAPDAPDLTPFSDCSLPREDFVACTHAPVYAITLDPKGQLNWSDGRIRDEASTWDNAHIIALVSPSVSDAYLGFLRSRGISYLFAGADGIDLPLAMEKLAQLFPIEALLLEGGGTTGRAFARAGLIDEVSFIMAPTMGEADAMGLFGPDDADVPDAPTFAHREILPVPGGAIWVRQWK